MKGMRLSDTDPRFLETNGAKRETMPAEGHLSMLCPKCLRDKPSGQGVHRLILPYSSRADHWHAVGASIEDFTFVPPGNTSVRVVEGCQAHFHIVKGEIKFV